MVRYSCMDPNLKQPHKTVTVPFGKNVYVATYSAGSHAVTVHSITGPGINSGYERYGLGGTSAASHESTVRLLTLQFLEEHKRTADRATGPGRDSIVTSADNRK